jgi:hypothetical protein
MASHGDRLPGPARNHGLTALLVAQEGALEILRRRAFSATELVALEGS